ncbi:phage holin family protein [Aliiruegeria lutimaris]|uniref:4 TMS phage holin, superfamily IV n=1 Tax=Aliiruegeria lutimaris TaxID=571298 RepID=A0A1G9BMI5_9RHOB|nr:phage holin family protein [Aliiruegeria lutimaris]SDK40613.1 4 TMS phage holin, superfamily IV [Aliiruegeria lutimaris]
MVRMLINIATHILANAVGLFVASVLLGESFSFTAQGFIVATLLLSLAIAIAGPVIESMSEKSLPALKGGVALVTTFVGLWITTILVGGMQITGLSTWLLGTLIVWVATMIAIMVLPMFLLKKYVQSKKDDKK